MWRADGIPSYLLGMVVCTNSLTVSTYIAVPTAEDMLRSRGLASVEHGDVIHALVVWKTGSLQAEYLRT